MSNTTFSPRAFMQTASRRRVLRNAALLTGGALVAGTGFLTNPFSSVSAQSTPEAAAVPGNVLNVPSATSPDFEERIRERIIQAWRDWKPGYEDWLAWSNRLYLPDATIRAIGDEPVPFNVYQGQMKAYRDAFDMEIGSFDWVIVEGDVVAVSYPMYMTQKIEFEGRPVTGERVKVPTTEFNRFTHDPENPMVMELWLLSAGL